MTRGPMKRILLLAALSLPLFAQRPVFNIMNFGAKNDGSASSTAAFKDAIASCAKAGGGTVFVPAGKYTAGAIVMVSNMTLEIDSGAVVNFVANHEEYPMTQSRFEGVETQAPAAMIGGYKLENIAITGHRSEERRVGQEG